MSSAAKMKIKQLLIYWYELKVLVRFILHKSDVEHGLYQCLKRSPQFSVFKQPVNWKEKKLMNAIIRPPLRGFITCVACITYICGLSGWQTAREYWSRSTATQTEEILDSCSPERTNSTEVTKYWQGAWRAQTSDVG